VKHINLALFAPVLFVSTFACTVHAADVDNATHALTRQEVRADLEAWQQAGLAQEWRGDGTPDIYNPEYQRKMAIYQRLRAEQANSVKR